MVKNEWSFEMLENNEDERLKKILVNALIKNKISFPTYLRVEKN